MHSNNNSNHIYDKQYGTRSLILIIFIHHRLVETLKNKKAQLTQREARDSLGI